MASFSREASAESPLASARGLLNSHPVETAPKKTSFLSRLRSSGKSNTFNMAKDIAQVRSATREGDVSDPLRITVSKFDKSQQHQPPAEDDNTYPSPDNRYLQGRDIMATHSLPPGHPLNESLRPDGTLGGTLGYTQRSGLGTTLGRTLGGTSRLSQTARTPTSVRAEGSPTRGRSMEPGRFPVPHDLRDIIAANSPRKQYVDRDFAKERSTARDALYANYGDNTPSPSLAATMNGQSAADLNPAQVADYVRAAAERILELEQQSRLLREEASGVVGQDNLEHALQEVAKERQPSQAFSLA